MEKRCAVCGQEVKGGIVMGATLLCRECEPDVSADMDRLRSEGKPVNVAHIARRLYRDRIATTDYIFRDVPDDLWDRVKLRSIQDKCAIRDVLLAAIRAYVG